MTKSDRRDAQFAALPWRRSGEGTVEVLLITSRETRRWVLPKGWPKSGEPPQVSTAREALEEAGVEGAVTESAVGVYRYEKRLKTGDNQPVEVAVYALEVLVEREVWPEAHEREKLWISPAEAADLVDEPELRALIAAFSP
jgi:8-oxo-dGTP pyrophosphatase MutT (NUDIX family)